MTGEVDIHNWRDIQTLICFKDLLFFIFSLSFYYQY